MEVALLFTLVIGLLVIGVPIAVALGMSSLLFLLAFSDSSLASVAQTLFSAFEGHYTLLAIPFFILASSFMTTGGVAQRIIRFSIACVGHLPGGLGHCRRFCLHAVRSPVRFVASNCRGDWNDRDWRHDPSWLFKGFCCRCDLQCRYAGNSYSALYRDGCLCGFGGSIGWTDVSRWRHPGAFGWLYAYDRDLCHGKGEKTYPKANGEDGERFLPQDAKPVGAFS
jgi:hypothetical protein